MKKPAKISLLIIALLFVFSFFLVGCKTVKNTKSTTETNITKKDSSSVFQKETVSQPIIDKLIIKVPEAVTADKNCDSLAQIAVNNALKSLNASKQSGDNSYEIKYNELLKEFEVLIKVGATKNTYNKQFKESNSAKDSKEIIEVPVIQPLTKEQNFNLWTGRIFWVLLTAYGIYRFSRIFTT